MEGVERESIAQANPASPVATLAQFKHIPLSQLLAAVNLWEITDTAACAQVPSNVRRLAITLRRRWRCWLTTCQYLGIQAKQFQRVVKETRILEWLVSPGIRLGDPSYSSSGLVRL